MSETDVADGRGSLARVVHRLEVCEEDGRGRYYRVDIGEERLGLIRRDDLAHFLLGELAQRVGIALQ